MELHLMRPEWLWALLPAVLLGILLWRARDQRGNWQSVIAPELLSHLVGENAGTRSRNMLPFILVGWLLAVVAAAGPSWQKIPQPVHQKQDALIILFDLSYSMKSGDLAPSRVDRARQKLHDLLQQRREGQTGLIAFAGDAHIVTPLTDDTDTIANLLPALQPDMMPVPGSDPTGAAQLGLELLRSAGISQGQLLLLTDAITEEEQAALAKLLTGSGVQLAVMGVGTTNGAPIPLPRGGFLKDTQGTIVVPGLKENTMRELARNSGGRYMRMQIDDSDFDYLLADNTLPDTAQTLALDRSADTWEDQGYLLLLPLLPLVLGLFRRGWLLCLLPLMLLAEPRTASAQSWDDLWLRADQQGQRALQNGDLETATQLFDDDGWAGTAAYQSGDYEAAGEHFAQQDSADGLYNRGNALARAGQLEEAIEAFRQSLELAPEQQDAMDNLALLEQLQEQQEQQEQQQQDQQEQQQNEDGDSQQENQDQASDGQPSQQDGDSTPQEDSRQNPQDQSDNSPEEAGQEQSETGTGEEQEAPGQPQPQPQPEEDADEEGQLAQQPMADAQQSERDQAMEQWLRRIPDDPSGLLREKFRYESERREQDNRRDNERYW